MKKTICMILIASMVLVTGCGNNGNNSGKTKNVSSNDAIGQETESETETGINTDKATPLEVGKDYTCASDVNINLIKVITSDKIQCISGKGSYITANDGESYIDVIFDLTNNGSGEFDYNHNVTSMFVGSNGEKYEDHIVATDDGAENLEQFDNIMALGKCKMHVACSVPSGTNEGTIYIKIGDDVFSLEYNSEADISNKTQISMNKKVEAQGYASFKIKKTEFTNDVRPSITSGYYTHYQIDDPANYTYYVVYADVTNLGTNAVESDSVLSIKAIFDGKYEYDANLAYEQKDGEGFDYSSITSINSLETRKGVFMFEVPISVKKNKMKAELSIYFNGQEYSISE